MPRGNGRSDRLRPGGDEGWAEAVIRDASATETALQRTEGIRGAFTTDQTERYDAIIAIDVRIFDPAGKELAYASATARHSRTVAEDATLNDRERAWYGMTDGDDSGARHRSRKRDEEEPRGGFSGKPGRDRPVYALTVPSTRLRKALHAAICSRLTNSSG